jgi:AraC-like DNA-binding protein
MQEGSQAPVRGPALRRAGAGGRLFSFWGERTATDSARLNDFFNGLQALIDSPARTALTEIAKALRTLDSSTRSAQFLVIRDVIAGFVLRLRRIPDAERYRLLQDVFTATDTAQVAGVLEGWLAHKPRALDPRVRAVLDHVVAQFNNRPHCRLAYLAQVGQVSPSHLCRLVHKETGRCLTDHLRQARVDSATKLMLSDPRRPLSLVAADVGYTDETDLCKNFKLVTGCSPKQYVRLSHTIAGDVGSSPSADS